MVYTAEGRALTNTSELHSFLGLVNCYGLHSAPPTESLAAERSYLGVVQKCEEAFQAINGMLSSDQVLAPTTLLCL